MNIKRIISVVQGPSGGKGESGIYSSKYCSGVIKTNSDSKLKKLSLVSRAQQVRAITPRLVKSMSGGFLALTREYLWRLHMDSVGDFTEGDDRINLSDLFRNHEDATEADEIFNNENLTGSIKNIGDDVLLAFYVSDNSRSILKPGFLFHYKLDDLLHYKELNEEVVPKDLESVLEESKEIDSKNGSKEKSISRVWKPVVGENSRSLVPGLLPTGEIIGAEKGFFYLVCNNVLKKVSLNEWDIENFISLKDIGSRILSADYQDGFTVCTDNRQGYVIYHESASHEKMFLSREKKRNQHPVINNRDRQYLPSNAMSTKIVPYLSERKEKVNYLLFGTNNGTMLLYQLDLDRGSRPYVEYLKTISFLSSGKAMETNKDSFIREIDYDLGWVMFTLRNFRVRISMKQLLDCEENLMISPKQENGKNYAENFLAFYECEQVCKFPHRIRSSELTK